ncbi:MAG TPA: alanine racemase [Anaerolineaceae bacterium]
MPQPDSYPTWLEINLSAVEKNVQAIRRISGVDSMAVVKANGYGYGSVEISRAALAGGAAWLGVHRYNEARILREAGIQAPILVLGIATAPEVDEAIAGNITLTLYSQEVAEMISQRAAALGRQAKVHLKVDTGMGRLGVLPSEAVALAQSAAASGDIHIDGVYSHFAMADLADHPLTTQQVQRFRETLQCLHEADFNPRWVHISNTGGTLGRTDAWFNLVRPGSGIYGIWPFDDLPYPDYLSPVLTWKARLASCKRIPAGWALSYGQVYTLTHDEWIGVVPVGYGDGYRRRYGTEMLIGGRRIPVRGTVCMDQCMVSLPERHAFGEEVVVLGRQGDACISLPELARRWNTAQLEVVTNISLRVPRVYVRD